MSSTYPTKVGLYVTCVVSSTYPTKVGLYVTCVVSSTYPTKVGLYVTCVVSNTYPTRVLLDIVGSLLFIVHNLILYFFSGGPALFLIMVCF